MWYFIGNIVTFLIIYQVTKDEEVDVRVMIAIIAGIVFPLVIAGGLFIGFIWTLMLLSDWLFDTIVKYVPKFKIKG